MFIPPKRARASGPDCATKVVHKCPCGGLLMTRLLARVDNLLEERVMS